MCREPDSWTGRWIGNFIWQFHPDRDDGSESAGGACYIWHGDLRGSLDTDRTGKTADTSGSRDPAQSVGIQWSDRKGTVQKNTDRKYVILLYLWICLYISRSLWINLGYGIFRTQSDVWKREIIRRPDCRLQRCRQTYRDAGTSDTARRYSPRPGGIGTCLCTSLFVS